MTAPGPAHIVILPILVPLVVGALMLLFEDRERRLKQVLSLGSILALAGIAVTLVVRIGATGPATPFVYLLGNWPAPVAITLVADRLAAAMLLLTALLALPAVLFATERWERAGPHFQSMLQFLLVGLNGAFLTGDLFNLFVFFEVMLAASYGLVLHGGGAQRVRYGMHYIAINLVASLVFLIGIAMVVGAVGTLNMAEIAERAETLERFARPAFHVGLAMLGVAFLIKAGTWPLCHWLVPAYAAAAGPAAAVFALLSKVGVYALIRLALLLPGDGTEFGSVVLFSAGTATLAFASIGVLASQSMKRAAGYFILMSSGTILASLGTATPGGTAGALYYLVSSTLATGAFFLVVEILEREHDITAGVLGVTQEAFVGAGPTDVDDPESPIEGGTGIPGGAMVIGVAFALLAMVLVGLPPLSGFLAKFAILSAVLGPASEPVTTPGGLRAALAVLMIVSGLVSLIALTRMGLRTFWAPPEPFTPRVTTMESAPIVLLLGLLVVLSVAAGPAMGFLRATADDLHAPSGYLEAVLGAARVERAVEVAP